MKKFKKNLSKTIFASFFVFQFVVSTSVMPLIVNAEDIVSESSDTQSSSEEKVSEATKEEGASFEESTGQESSESSDSEVSGPEVDLSTTEEKPSEEIKEEESKPASDISKEPTKPTEEKPGKPTKPEDGKKSSATVRVCKVILDENGNQVEGAEFPGAEFSLTLGIQGGLKTVTLAADDYADKRFVYEGGNAFHAMCDETVLEFDPSLVVGGTVYAKYFEEETSGDYLWKENYNDGDVSGDAGFENKYWSYFDEGGLNDLADGKLILTGNTATGFEGKILLVNKFDKYVDPTATNKGSITVCKIIAKQVNGTTTLASASEVPGYTFTVPWIDEPTTPGTQGFNSQPVISPDATFATNSFAPNKKILSSSNGNDAMCQTFPNLTLGSYYYGEETIAGGDGFVTWTTKYSDQVLLPVNDFGDVDTYRNNIFTVGLDLAADPKGSIDANGNAFNTNADGHIVLNRSNAGRNRTIVVVNIFDDKRTPPKFCESTRNLITNPSFETPEVSNAGWDIYGNGTAGLGWTVAWNGINPNVAPKLELQENVSGWDAHTGDQYAELDADQNGHVGNLNGEPASTKISQVINTVPGQFYKVTYHFAARPGTPESDNRLGFYVDGELYDDVSASGLGLTQPYWQTRIFAFYAEGTQTTISFADLGNPNSFGTFLDSVEVVCVDDEDPQNTPPKIIVNPLEVCLPTSAESYKFLSGVSAQDAEDGDLTSEITFTPNTIVFGTSGTHSIEYSVTDSNGATVTATRTILIKENCGGGGGDKHPTITLPENQCYEVGTTNFNFLTGVVARDSEGNLFTLDLVAHVTGEQNIDFTQVGQDPDLVTYKFTDPYTGEIAEVTRSFFISADCDNGGGGDDEDPTITISGGACILTSATSFDFMSGVTVTDDEGAGNVTTTNDGSTVVTFGTAGTYTVTYTATDSDGNTATATRTITIDEDCDNGGGGGGDDDLVLDISDACVERGAENFDVLSGLSVKYLGETVALDDEALEITTASNPTLDLTTNGSYTITYTVEFAGETETTERVISVQDDCDNGGGGGGGGGGGSSSSGGSRGNRGEVLGAATCVAFTTYNRLGNRGGEIKALQTFLNEYMDAGLTVDGVYGRTTAQAVHDFQAFHWSEVIDPWTPPLSPNTTGWQYKTTRATINAIIDCPEPAVYLEDPGVMYEVTEVKDMKPFTTEQMEMIYNLLAEAQSGQVLGATDSNVVTPDIFDPNYDLMFGK